MRKNKKNSLLRKAKEVFKITILGGHITVKNKGEIIIIKETAVRRILERDKRILKIFLNEEIKVLEEEIGKLIREKYKWGEGYIQTGIKTRINKIERIRKILKKL